MPRIRWARRLQDGAEQYGIECICGGDMLPIEGLQGAFRCDRCQAELLLHVEEIPEPPTTRDWFKAYLEDIYRRDVARGRGSRRGRRWRRKPVSRKRPERSLDDA